MVTSSTSGDCVLEDCLTNAPLLGDGATGERERERERERENEGKCMHNVMFVCVCEKVHARKWCAYNQKLMSITQFTTLISS